LTLRSVNETGCGGRLSQAGRLWVLETRGDAQARGRQHGGLLREQIQLGATPILARRAFDLPELRAAHPSARQALAAIVIQIYADILAHMPDTMREELRGLAEGAELDFETVFRASFLSEALQQLATFKSARAPAAAHGGCTAAVALGPRASGGASIHAKNQDYDGGGVWDKYPLVHVAHPEEGFAHVTATTAGLLKGNLTLNAAGVTIGGHFLFSSAAGRFGRSFTVLEREVALNAGSVDEAVSILRAAPCAGSFAFVITDRSGAGVAAECDGEGVRVRQAQAGVLGMSNLFMTEPGSETKDLLRVWGAHRIPLARQSRIDALLAELPKKARVETVAALLADRFDPISERRRGPAAVIAQPSTVTAAVAETASLRFWVGESECPASHGRFIGFDLSSAFAGAGEVSIAGALENGDPADSQRIGAFRLFLQARAAFMLGGEGEETARELLLRAESLDPLEAAYPRFLARLCLRGGDLDTADAALHRSILLPQGQNEQAECALLRGYVADLNGDRKPALAHYRSVIEEGERSPRSAWDWINPGLCGEARAASDAAFTPVQARALPVSFDLMSGLE
jgi:isopenicillin-N N-acyltransferase-like protein